MEITINLNDMIKYFTITEKFFTKELVKSNPTVDEILNVGEIAYNVGVSAPTATICLNKLNCIGVIETLSLGRKGTIVRFVNKEALEYLGGIL